MFDSTPAGVLLVLLLTTVALVSNELTHLLCARLIAPVSVTQVSYLPFRVELSFETEVQPTQVWLVALAPTVVGGLAGVMAVSSGFWALLQSSDPYYLWFILLLNWIVYSIPSPTDLRTLM
jgi:hypothetical protein